MTDSDNRYLAWFLGPKAENGPLFEDLLLLVLRDYVHWRRNYYPGDSILLNRSLQRRFEDEQDALAQRVSEITAELRRNFPFYSPRYIAHQLSDTTLPAMIGYLAGMLYNPNNVTPEAAPVTVDWEIEACSRVLRMLGYTPPPEPKRDGESGEDYARRMRKEFGWAHITSGGTAANIEALWVARSVRYLPLAIRDVAVCHDLSIETKTPAGETVDLRALSEYDVLMLRPNDAIYLLARYVDAIRQHDDLTMERAGTRAWELLNESPYAPANGTSAAFARFQPVVFVSGAAHYSISKSADILGIGKNNVIKIRMDDRFRLDIDDLRVRIDETVAAGKIPLGVVAIVGTTEEGAVDPIDRILDLRAELEHGSGISFWLHLDAAWGGYIRTLFCLDRDDEAQTVAAKLATAVGVPFQGDLNAWHAALVELAFARAQGDAEVVSRLDRLLRRLDDAASGSDLEVYTAALRDLVHVAVALAAIPMPPEECFRLTLSDRAAVVSDYVQSTVHLQRGDYRRELKTAWGSRDIAASFLAMGKADSITVDPHKMGYVPYPCGVVAFKNDRVRHFVLQAAPYITSVQQNALLHMPPKHTADWQSGGEGQVVIEAFAPFILEGSRPGAAASSLWLATQTIPLTMRRHGSIVRASLLGARELYEWLVHWGKIAGRDGSLPYDFVLVPGFPPDTNIVTFAVKAHGQMALSSMNRLTSLVYEAFTIQAELGEREYSYSQPFFLSKTTMSLPHYPCKVVGHVLDRSDIREWRDDYAAAGMTVLRATVMNPYMQAMEELGVQSLIREFMDDLHRAACSGAGRLGDTSGQVQQRIT